MPWEVTATFSSSSPETDAVIQLWPIRRRSPWGLLVDRGGIKDVHWFFHIDQLIQDGGAQ